MNNISLDSFRTISNGTHNLGFVKLTHQDGDTIGLTKANNHYIMGFRNNEDTSASVDNRIVREQLLNAFRNEGASEGFLADIRERLGLNNNQREAAVLMRNEVREIVQLFDGRVGRHDKSFDRIAETVFGADTLRNDRGLAEQVNMVKSRYTVALATSAGEEQREILGKIMQALNDLKAVFAPDDLTRSIAENARKLEEGRQAAERIKAKSDAILKTLEERAERIKAFDAAFASVEGKRDAYIKKVDEEFAGKGLPGYDERQNTIIHQTIAGQIRTHVLRLGDSLRETFVKGEIGVKDLEDRLERAWLDIEVAVEEAERDLVMNADTYKADTFDALRLRIGVLIDKGIGNPQ